MLKLTRLEFETKSESLERLHSIEQHIQDELYDWEQELETARSVGGDYVPQPYIEPFEFTEDDFIITEKPYRIRKEDILSYSEDKEGRTTLTERGSMITYNIKESVDLLDKICEAE